MTGLDILKQRINSLRPLLKKGAIDESVACHLMQRMNDIIGFLFVPIFNESFDKIIRITVNKRIKGIGNNRIISLEYLKYPPASCVSKYGRANFNNQSRFYATFNPISAINEMKPEIGDLITETTWKLRPEKKLIVVPIFFITSGDNGETHNALSINYKLEYDKLIRTYPEEEYLQYNELLNFVSECFAKDVDYGNTYDYFLSAFFSNRIFNEINKGEVEAIVYPSVSERLGFSNIVIKPNVFDDRYELFEINEKIVKNNKPCWYLEPTGYTKNVKGNVIIW